MSRIQDHATVALDQLGPALETHKASALFAQRTDLEIAGDDAASYGSLARAIDTAVAAGFTAWQLMPPDQLATHP